MGTTISEKKSLSSACHGAGRAMSRHQAMKKWSGGEIIRELADQGILIRSGSYRGVAEEAPGACHLRQGLVKLKRRLIRIVITN